MPITFLGPILTAMAVGGAQSAPPAVITLDRTKSGPRISRYVYGQFIEHLGRCIRQGIWAEMLRDRKFLQEPGQSWTVVAPQGAPFEAIHAPDAAYAGEKGIDLWLKGAPAGPCGIQQAGLGVRARKEYAGYGILSGAGKPAKLTVTLRWAPGPDGAQSRVVEVGPTYKRYEFRFTAAADSDDASLSVTLDAAGHAWIGALSLMPADNVRGMRADTLDLIRQVGAPITRWPGGNFVSGYNWKDGIGDRDRRPPRWERAWNDIEDNDFGLDEFMDFCAEVKTEPYICVNAGLGSAQDAADEVQYANGSESTIWGAARARNGHRRPYNVVWWGVGNEMYGDWQLGNIPVARYADRHNAYVGAMRAVDQKIKIVGVGSPGSWNDEFVGRSVGAMDLLSGHHYSSRELRMPLSDADRKTYADRFPEYSASVAAGIRSIVQDFRGRTKDPARAALRLAIDEWGIVRDWNPAPDGMGIGSFEHYYPLGDAIAAARGLHEILRNADVVEMANWAQLVNVIAAIKTSRTEAVMDPVGYMLAVYGGNLVGRLLPIETPNGLPIDIIGAKDTDQGFMSAAIVNYSLTDDVTLDVRIPDGKEQSCLCWTLTGRSFADTNVPGQPELVTLKPLRGLMLPGVVTVPKHSIFVLRYAIPKE